MGFGRSLYFSGLSSVSKVVIQFGLSIFVARVLTPEELGSFGVALAASAFLRAFESAGINNFVASHKELDKPLLRTVFSVNTLLNVAIGLLIWAIAAPMARFYASPAIETILELTALGIALNTHVPLMRGLLRRDMRFKALMGLDLGLMAINGATIIIGVTYGLGPIALALALVVERLASILFGVLAFGRSIPMLPRLRDAKIVLNYGLSLSTATFISIVGSHSNNFILGKILGLAPAAQFDRGYTLPRLMAQVALMSFHNVLVPEVARQAKAGNPCAPILQDVTRLYTMVLWPAGAVLAILAPEVVLTLFGDQWRLAADISPYFVIFGLITSPVNMACSALVALGHGKALIKNQLAEQGSKILVFMSALFVDVRTLPLLLVIPTVLYVATALGQLNALGLISPKAFGTAVLRPLRITAICALPALLADIFLAGEGYLTLIELGGVGLVSVLIYGSCMLLLERPTLTKALEAAGLTRTSNQ
ncbi:MAG: oligosaccharide flippase family protein [Alphaproteobacteria bacterium]|nr:oligosaccharide flippase family protein [Alphaproteobacteria bacterium]